MANVRGNCYVASEALYHCFAKELGYRPYVMHWKGDTHWFLGRESPNFQIPRYHQQKLFEVLDPSVKQFKKCDKPTWNDYCSARACGFLTLKPSKRAKKLIKELTWQS